ncbi:class I SAM-dependent methyltransferase [Candidatus Poribacteria bacterium]|nr:class I SAM-dependent methyltransferase [Candidatus Poribacteria bacterium]
MRNGKNLNLLNANHDYWNNKIIEWEKSAYEKDSRNSNFIEKIANLFRGIVRERMALTIKTLSPFVKDKTIIDIGCGSGILASELLKFNPKKIIGIDISENAIAKAKKCIIDKRCDFFIGDALNFDLPESDIIVGLGVLDFIPKNFLPDFLKKIKSKYFLFSFPERSISPYYYMIQLYRISQNCPTHNYYSYDELKNIMNNFFSINKIFHITNRKMHATGIIHNLF